MMAEPLLESSPLDRPLQVTVWFDQAPKEAHGGITTMRTLALSILKRHAPSKHKLYWLKLATFGNVFSEKKTLRNNINVRSVSGLEGDYDDGEHSFEWAVEQATKANIGCLIYTSPSHTPEAPRWRVLAPFSEDLSPELRRVLMGRLNGAFGGIFSGESWTLSQSYYYGYVEGNGHNHQVELVDGEAIDLLHDLDKVWRDKPNTKPRYEAEGNEDGPSIDFGELDVNSTLEAIRTGQSYHPAIRSLAAKFIGEGRQRHEVYKIIMEAGDQVPVEMRDRRWHDRFSPHHVNDILSWVISAEKKKLFTPYYDDEYVDPPPEQPRKEPPPKNPERFIFEKIPDLRLLPPTQWMVDRWIPERSIGIFYGKWAAGKSFVGFDLGLHLAYGMADWHGAKLPGQPTEVLVIAREGHAGFVKRVDAFKKHYGIIDDAMPFTFMRGSVSFMNSQDFADLCAAIRNNGTKFGLVIIDTVARVTAGEDTNEQKVATLFMERCQAIGEITGATTIGVHHQNKSGTMMGSIYFEANADFVFEISREGEDGPLEAGEIRCTKQKDGEDGWKQPVAYKKIPLNLITDEGSLVVSSIGGGSVKPVAGLPDKETCKRILNAINEAWIKGAPWHPHPNTEKLGRFAISNIMREFSVKRNQAENLVHDWQKNAVLVVAQVNSDTKLKGLKVLQWP